MDRDDRKIRERVMQAYGTPELDDRTRERMWNNIHRKRAEYETRSPKLRRFATLVTSTTAMVAVGTGAYVVINDFALRTADKAPVQIPKPELSKVSLAGIGFASYPNPNSRIRLVSPDGQWVLVPGSSGHPDLEDMNGRRYAVLQANQLDAIYGATNDGAIILAYAAGGAPLAFAYSPKRGVELKFPTGDSNAKVAYFASESSRGDWATLVAHRSGAGPGTKPWLDINGQSIRSLQDATEFFGWSPKGEILAVLLQTPGGSLYQLAFYNQSVQRMTGSVTVPNDNIVMDDPRIQTNQMAWSPDGSYVGVGTNHGICIVDAKVGHTAMISPKTKIPDWNWVSADELYVVNHNQTHRSIVDFYTLKSFEPVATVRVPGMVEQERVVAKNEVLMQNDSGAVYLVSPQGAPRLVASHTRVWWFDTKTQDLFYATKKNTSNVWRVSMTALLAGGKA